MSGSPFRPHTTIEQWRIFQAVVDYGGYTQAAEALNKSQSSLNHAVAKLQESLGVALLEVQGRKAVLTPKGRELLQQSRVLLQQVEALESLVQVRPWEQQITLHLTAMQPREKIYRALAQFAPEARGCQIQIYEHQQYDPEKLEAGALLLGESRGSPRTGLPLDQITLHRVVAKAHPLANDYHTAQLTTWPELTLTKSVNAPHPQWLVESYASLLALVLMGIGYGWLPEFLIGEALATGKLIDITPQGEERQRQTYLFTPKPKELGPATELLLRHLRHQYQNG